MTIEQVQEKFYADASGKLFYKVDSGIWGRIKAGTVAGGIRPDGYLEVRLKQRLFLVHHVIWALNHGAWPQGLMDHINGNRTDNRIQNLRDVCDRVNAENKHAHQSNNKLRLLGVTYRRNRNTYTAKINVCGKCHYLGEFKLPEQAHKAYLAAKRRLHEGCTI